MRILVVDDDDVTLAIIRKVLLRENHEVLVARDGEDALNILRTNDIPVVISDWNMPRMDGGLLCQHIRETPALSHTYVILVTSRATKDDKLVGLWAGADDYLTKPFDPVELLLRVRHADRIAALEGNEATVFCLARLLESKAPETGDHLERMRIYSTILAEQLVADEKLARLLPARFPQLIHYTSPLHDIGKVGIPDNILLKPDSLNDYEWTVMKRHAEIGAQTLNDAVRMHPNAAFLHTARDIAWAHHERWDGSGYPRGLKGDEIPWAARVVALADVYDALTSVRVYKAANSHDTARSIILQGNGTHFDPLIVQAFLAIEAKFIAVRQTVAGDVAKRALVKDAPLAAASAAQ